MSLLTKFSLKNRAAVVIMVLLVSILGVTSGLKLPMEFLPSLDAPQITVTAVGQGLDAETMTEEVTEPLEKEFKNATHMDSIISNTTEGMSIITITYTSDADMKEAAREAEKMAGQVQLPQNVMKPFVTQLNTSMIPIAQVAIQSDSGFIKQDEELIEKEIKTQFENIDGVSNVMFYGKSNTQLDIKVNPDKWNEKQVNGQQLLMALQGKNVSVPAGNITLDGTTNALRVMGEVKNVDDIKNIMVGPGVKLSDVADVKIDSEYEAITRINGDAGLALVIQKEASKNAVSIGKEIDKLVKSLDKQYKDQFKISMMDSTGEQVENAVMGMAREVGIGALAATVIILLFLRNIRTTLIAVVSIPLSVMITLFLLEVSNITLNILTLGGLAIAVGRLVDDSIVVIENIFRRLQHEKSSGELILDATKEVAVAITSSTLTTIAVFLPIGLVSGAIGELMLPMVLAVVYSILASLLVALTVVPLMSFVLLKNVKQTEEKPATRYVSILKWSLSHKFIVILLSFLIFAGSIAAYASIPQTNAESEDQSNISIMLTFPADYDLEKAKEQAVGYEALLMEQDKTKDVFFRMGSTTEDARWGQASSSNEAMFYVAFEKGQNIDKFIEDMKEHNKDYKPAKIEFVKASLGGFGGGNNIQLNVTAANEKDLVESAELAMAELKEIKGLDKIKSNFEDLKNEWVVDVDQDKAQQLGFTPQAIAEQVRTIMGETPLGQIEIDGEKMMMVLDYEDQEYKNKEAILNTIITSPVAGPVKLSQVAAIKEEKIKTEVFHKEGKETIQISADITGEDVKKIGLDVNQAMSKLDLPEGAEVGVAGGSESMNEMFGDLFRVMAIAIGIVYLIMVITFGQARAPFAILFSLPLAAVGAIIGLMVTRTPVDPNALIGALMLIGIVVTNAIVLIERVHQNKDQGMITRDALLEAGSTRLRPIIMTAVTTIVAMLPLVFGSHEAGSMVSKSLAVVVIGGLAVSTILTLIVVPVMYELLIGSGLKKKKGKKGQVNQKEVVA